MPDIKKYWSPTDTIYSLAAKTPAILRDMVSQGVISSDQQYKDSHPGFIDIPFGSVGDVKKALVNSQTDALNTGLSSDGIFSKATDVTDSFLNGSSSSPPSGATPSGSFQGDDLYQKILSLFSDRNAGEANAFSAMSAEQVMDYNERMMKYAFDREEQLANTAHQREVADLKAAGLNPLLAYSSNGAAVPSVSPASTNPIQGVMASRDYSSIQSANVALRSLMADRDFYVALKQLEQGDRKLSTTEANTLLSGVSTLFETVLPMLFFL